MNARKIVMRTLTDIVADTERPHELRMAAAAELWERIGPAIVHVYAGARRVGQLVVDWQRQLLETLESVGTAHADDEHVSIYDGEPLPDGCWADVWRDHERNYVPCNRAPESNIGLCERHACELRRAQQEVAS